MLVLRTLIHKQRRWLIASAMAIALAITLPQWLAGPAPAYRVAAQLVPSGQFDARVYDDQWFGAQVRSVTNGTVSDIFAPSPPSLVLLILPIGFIPDSLQSMVWAIANFSALLLAIYLTLTALKHSQTFNAWLFLIVSVAAIISAPMQENLARGSGGQVYLFMLLLHAIAFWSILTGRDRIGGIALALLALFKLNGWPIWILLISVRRWRVLKWASAGVSVGVLISGAMVGFDVWRVYITQVMVARVFNPSAAVTAYQTVNGFFQHFFRFDAQWNPAPLMDVPWLAALGSLGITISLLAITWFRSRRISIEQSLGAAIVLSVILSPQAEQYHFLILIVPLIVLVVEWPRFNWLKHGLIIVAIGLVAIALPYKSPNLSAGLISLLAYPRLYGALIVWGLLCWSFPAAQSELTNE